MNQRTFIDQRINKDNPVVKQQIIDVLKYNHFVDVNYQLLKSAPTTADELLVYDDAKREATYRLLDGFDQFVSVEIRDDIHHDKYQPVAVATISMPFIRDAEYAKMERDLKSTDKAFYAAAARAEGAEIAVDRLNSLVEELMQPWYVKLWRKFK